VHETFDDKLFLIPAIHTLICVAVHERAMCADERGTCSLVLLIAWDLTEKDQNPELRSRGQARTSSHGCGLPNHKLWRLECHVMKGHHVLEEYSVLPGPGHLPWVVGRGGLPQTCLRATESPSALLAVDAFRNHSNNSLPIAQVKAVEL